MVYVRSISFACWLSICIDQIEEITLCFLKAPSLWFTTPQQMVDANTSSYANIQRIHRPRTSARRNPQDLIAALMKTDQKRWWSLKMFLIPLEYVVSVHVLRFLILAPTLEETHTSTCRSTEHRDQYQESSICIINTKTMHQFIEKWNCIIDLVTRSLWSCEESSAWRSSDAQAAVP